MIKKLTLIVIIFGTISYSALTYMGLPKALAASYSKEFCSCFFVEKQSEKTCSKYAQMLLPVLWHSINKTEKSITALGGFHAISKTRFVNQQFGCTHVD